MGMQPRIAGVEDAVVFLLRAYRVVAQLLHLVTRRAPFALQRYARLGVDLAATGDDPQHVVRVRAADGTHARREAGALEYAAHEREIVAADLDHRAELFGEQRGEAQSLIGS